jgi:hypothetical protein
MEPYEQNAVAPNVLLLPNSHRKAVNCVAPYHGVIGKSTLAVVLINISAFQHDSTNVAAPNAAKPSGPGFPSELLGGPADVLYDALHHCCLTCFAFTSLIEMLPSMSMARCGT